MQDNVNQFSENHLEVFYSRYAPSARMAYIHASDMDYYDRLVDSEISGLTFEGLEKMLTSAQGEGVSDQFLVVSPGSHRSDYLITLASRYIYQKLLEQLQIHTFEEVSRLYQIFMRNKCTEGSVGYILDDIHDLFRKGGEWLLTGMTKTSSGLVDTHFISPTRPFRERRYMRLGYQGEQITITRDPLPTTKGSVFYTGLEDHRFVLHQNMISLKDGYYQPAPGQTTFNGFIYNQASKTAIMLQMTVGEKHDVKPEDVRWMIGQGVEKVYIVAIKPPD